MSAKLFTPRNVVTDNIPSDWTSEQQAIAREGVQVLLRHYPGWAWALEWTSSVGNALGAIIVRLSDVPTKVVYVLNSQDIDRDRMTCFVKAGGTMLEALGLSRTKWRHDEVRGLKTTPSGLLIPDSAAVPETNPGYTQIKKDFDTVR